MASMDSNRVPFNADFILGNSKTRMVPDLASTVVVQSLRSCVLREKSSQRGQCVLVHCPGEQSMIRSSTFPVIIFSLTNCLQNHFIADQVYYLTFRYPSDVDDSLNVVENYHGLQFGFAHPLFLLLWGCRTLPMHGLLLGFRVVLENPSFITSNNILEEDWIISMFSRVSAQILIRCSFCSGVRSFGTIFAHTFLMRRFSCNICLTVSVSLSKVDFSPSAQMLRPRSSRTIRAPF